MSPVLLLLQSFCQKFCSEEKATQFRAHEPQGRKIVFVVYRTFFHLMKQQKQERFFSGSRVKALFCVVDAAFRTSSKTGDLHGSVVKKKSVLLSCTTQTLQHNYFLWFKAAFFLK